MKVSKDVISSFYGVLKISDNSCPSCKFATRIVKYIRTKDYDIHCCIYEDCSKGGRHGMWFKDDVEWFRKHHPEVYAQCDMWKSKKDERK